MDSHVQNWAENENVFYFVALADIGQPYTCNQWGDAGVSSIPVIVEDTGTIFSWLHDSWNAYPTYAVIDHEMRLADKPWPYGSTDNLIQSLYTTCEDAGLCGNPDSDSDGIVNADDNCPMDYNPDQADDDNDGIGDECDDCHNLPGDLTDDSLININDIVVLVNVILQGGYNSTMHTDCEKTDSDYNSDGIINVLDVIQVVNEILGNNSPTLGIPQDNPNSEKTVVYFQSNNEDLIITIGADQLVSGIELTYPGDPKSIELKDNSHIILEQNNLNGHNIVLAYSLLNTPFDSKTISFTLKDGIDLDPKDINLVVGSNCGVSLELIKSTETGVFQNGPYTFKLTGVYPNPFNPVSEISFTLPFDGNITLNVFNLQGQEVDVIFEGFQTSGVHSYNWDASHLSSGAYYIKLSDGVNQTFEKAILLK